MKEDLIFVTNSVSGTEGFFPGLPGMGDPFATEVEDAKSMIQVCKEEGVILQIAYPVRFASAVKKVKEIVQSGTEKHDTVLNATPQVDNHSFNFVKGFQNEIDHFVSYCGGEQETLSPIQDGVEMTKILCGIYESTEKGAEIYFN